MRVTVQNGIGIMQGRLSPQSGPTIQSFPIATWRDEFARAREAGLCCIEWIYETGTDGKNPLRTDEGVRAIRQAQQETEVAIRSICADYYMVQHLIDPKGRPVAAVKEHLAWLLSRAALLGCVYIVLPFVDSSSLKTPAQLDGLGTLLNSMAPVIEEHDVEIDLETDLHPAVLSNLLLSVNHPLVRVNYDIGNSASLGHDPREELTLLKGRIGSVHVKDRVRGGGTVLLGTGAADFRCCFDAFRSMHFSRPYILQAARAPLVSEMELAIRNRKFVESYLL